MAFTVSSGQTVKGQTLHKGSGTIYDVGAVLSGGTASLTRVENLGELNVSSGGIARSSTVYQGGTENLFGGMSLSDTIEGGVQYIYDTGSAVSAALTFFGEQIVMNGALALDTTDGGREFIEFGGIASDTIVKGGMLFVSGGGSAVGVDGAGAVSVFGTATNLTIAGFLKVASGATVTDVVGTGGLVMPVSGIATSVSLQAGGQLIVAREGVANAVTVGGSGLVDRGSVLNHGDMSVVSVGGNWTLDILAGGTASDVAVSGFSSGTSTYHAKVHDSGVVSGITLGSDAIFTVSAGGVAQSVTIENGGVMTVGSGGTASDVTAASASLTVLSGGSVTDVSLQHGVATVSAGGTLGDATLDGAGRLVLDAGAVDTASVSFVSHANILVWSGGGTLAATLAGFSSNNTVDLRALTFVSGGTATPSGLVLHVTEGGTTDTLNFASGTQFGGSVFKFSADAHGGTDVTLVVSAS